MVHTSASLFLLLAVSHAAVALPASRTVDADLQHLVRARRTVLLPVAKAVLDPLHLLDRGRGGGSDAHSGSVNLGATLPFGISAGISASRSDARSAAGGAASAGSNAAGGHPGNYGGAGSSASVGPACPICH